MNTLNDVLTAINTGICDDHIDAVIATARDRQKVAARTVFHTIRVGQTGRLVNCNPKYLNGAPLTVTAKNQTRIQVKLDADWLAAHPQATRWRGTVTCPPEMLDLDP